MAEFGAKPALTTPDRPRINAYPDGCSLTTTDNGLVRAAGRYTLCVLAPRNFDGARDHVLTVTAERP